MSAAEPTTVTVGHITLTDKPEGHVDAACGFPGCGVSVNVPPSFGGIPGRTLLLEWAKQHLHEPKPKPKRSRKW